MRSKPAAIPFFSILFLFFFCIILSFPSSVMAKETVTLKKDSYIGETVVLPDQATDPITGKTVSIDWPQKEGADYILRRNKFTTYTEGSYFVTGTSSLMDYTYILNIQTPSVLKQFNLSGYEGEEILLDSYIIFGPDIYTVYLSDTDSPYYKINQYTFTGTKAGKYTVKGSTLKGAVEYVVTVNALKKKPVKNVSTRLYQVYELPSTIVGDKGAEKVKWTMSAGSVDHKLINNHFTAYSEGTYELTGRTTSTILTYNVKAKGLAVIEKINKTITTGEQMALKTHLSINHSSQPLIWKEYQGSKTSVEGNYFTGKKPGVYTITGTAKEGKLQYVITVKDPVYKRKITDSVFIGDPYKLPKTVKIGSQKVPAAWTIPNSKYCKVSGDTITISRKGTYVFTANTSAGYAKITLEVKDIPVLKTITRSSITGYGVSLPKTYTYQGKKYKVQWNEADGKKYSLKGYTFTGKKSGTYKLKGRIKPGYIRCDITVKKPRVQKTGAATAYKDIPLALPKKVKIQGKNYKVTWNETDITRYTVNKYTFTGHRTTVLTLKGRTEKGYYKYKITVRNTPVISRKNVCVLVPDYYQLPQYYKYKGKTYRVDWTKEYVANKNAWYSQKEFKASREGTYKVKGFTKAGFLVFTIQAEFPKIECETDYVYGYGATMQMKLTGTSKKLSWDISDSSIASISKTGLLTAKREGSVKVYARYKGEVYAERYLYIHTGTYGSSYSESEGASLTRNVVGNTFVYIHNDIPKSRRTQFLSYIQTTPEKYRKHIRLIYYVPESEFRKIRQREFLDMAVIGLASGKTIYVADVATHEYNGFYNTPRHILYHEVGHVMDSYYDSKRILSNMPEWQSIADAEWTGDSHYAAGYNEAFAEAFSFYYEGRLSGRPRTYEFMKKYLG